jgi:hypothetical protein
VLRRSPTAFGVLLSFSFFAGLLTLLLLAQRTIPGRTPQSQEPLPTEIVGPSILAPTEDSSQTGATVPGTSVVTGPPGPTVPILGPAGGGSPSDQVSEPGTGPGQGTKPKTPDEGKTPSPPAEQQPTLPGGGQPAPSPPAGGGQSPVGQTSPPPPVLPPGGESDDDDDDDDGDEDGDDDGDRRANPGGDEDDDGDEGEDEDED